MRDHSLTNPDKLLILTPLYPLLSISPRWEAFMTNKNRGVAGGSSRSFSRPIPLVVGNAKNVLVKDIKIVNSPFWHNLVYQSSYVTYDDITIEAIS